MTYLRITTDSLAGGAAASVNLMFHSVANRSYMLTRGDWAPSIAGLRTAALGTAPYADMQEEIAVNVYGQTATECLSNLLVLARLLDQADRWGPKRGENVSAVRLQYTPTGGALMLESVILGRASGDETSGVQLPVTFNRDLGAFLIEGVRLRFWRQGLWLNPTAETASSTASANPTVQSITISSPTPISSPTGLSCTFQNAGTPTAGYMDQGIILTASASSRLQLYDTTGFSYGTNVANFNDSANLARNTNVARYSPGVLSSNLSAALSGFDTTARMVAIYAAVRNNSATTAFTIQVRANAVANGTTVFGPVIPVDNSSTSPRIMFLGIVRTRQQIDNVALLLTASAASGTLDINYFALQAIDDETSGALSVFDSTVTGKAGGAPLTVDSKILSEPTPLVTSLTGGVTYNLSYTGMPIFQTRGSLVATILGTDLTLWRVADGVTLLNTVFAATRYGAYLVPQ